MTSSNVPEDVLEAVQLIRDAGTRTYLTRADKENVNRAKLRVAFWACRTEGIMASRENLTYVLGADAAEIMNNYDKYLERSEEGGEEGDGKRTTKKGGAGFWENA
jgi:hypothetical protein